MSLKDIKNHLQDLAATDRIDNEMRAILARPGGVYQAISMFVREAKLTGDKFGIDGQDRGGVPVVIHPHTRHHRVSIEKPDGTQFDIERDAILWAEAMRRARST